MKKSLVGDLKGKGISVVKDDYRDNHGSTFPPCTGDDKCVRINCECKKKEKIKIK